MKDSCSFLGLFHWASYWMPTQYSYRKTHSGVLNTDFLWPWPGDIQYSASYFRPRYRAITQQVCMCHKLFWGQLISEQPSKSHCVANVMHGCVIPWKMCCGSSPWVQKVYKKDYESLWWWEQCLDSVSCKVLPGPYCMVGYAVAEQWRTWPLFFHMAMTPRVVNSLLAPVCFDYHNNKLIII